MVRKHAVTEPDLGPFGPLILHSVAKDLHSPSRRKYVGVRIEFAFWLGRSPTPSERVALSRNVSRLETLGLVFRMPGRRLVLTKAGKRLTDNLAGFPKGFTQAEMEQIFSMPIDALFLPEPGTEPKPRVGGPAKPESVSPPTPNFDSVPTSDQDVDRYPL